ncbi:MAG: hypothetical protein ACRC57_07535 [Sarcina sp.]
MFENYVKMDDIIKNKYLSLEFKPNIKIFLLTMITINTILLSMINSMKSINLKAIESMVIINIGALVISLLLDVFLKKVNVYRKYRYLLGDFLCHIDKEYLYLKSKNRDIKIDLTISKLEQNENYSIIVDDKNFKVILINNEDVKNTENDSNQNNQTYEELINLISKKVQGA